MFNVADSTRSTFGQVREAMARAGGAEGALPFCVMCCTLGLLSLAFCCSLLLVRAVRFVPAVCPPSCSCRSVHMPLCAVCRTLCFGLNVVAVALRCTGKVIHKEAGTDAFSQSEDLPRCFRVLALCSHSSSAVCLHLTDIICWLLIVDAQCWRATRSAALRSSSASPVRGCVLVRRACPANGDWQLCALADFAAC